MIPRRTRRYYLLLAAAGLWLVVLVLPPLAASWTGTTADWAYAPLAKLCHQKPERSFFLAGHPLGVCHRCTGIYAGFFMGILLFPFLDRFSRFLVARPRWLVLFAVPMALDVLFGNTPLSRFVTGFVAGFPVALFAWIAAEQFPSLISTREVSR